jgi:hypothetical protein
MDTSVTERRIRWAACQIGAGLLVQLGSLLVVHPLVASLMVGCPLMAAELCCTCSGALRTGDTGSADLTTNSAIVQERRIRRSTPGRRSRQFAAPPLADLACGTDTTLCGWLNSAGGSMIDGSPRLSKSFAAAQARASRLTSRRFLKNRFMIEPALRPDRDVLLSTELDEQCRGPVPGGVMVAIALLIEPGKEHSAFAFSRVSYAATCGLKILHHGESDAWRR